MSVGLVGAGRAVSSRRLTLDLVRTDPAPDASVTVRHERALRTVLPRRLMLDLVRSDLAVSVRQERVRRAVSSRRLMLDLLQSELAADVALCVGLVGAGGAVLQRSRCKARVAAGAPVRVGLGRVVLARRLTPHLQRSELAVDTALSMGLGGVGRVVSSRRSTLDLVRSGLAVDVPAHMGRGGARRAVLARRLMLDARRGGVR
ncbi:hypothetical protein [Nocardia sp. NPDC057030]|uniref:hypothetical protein n=1 Tax=unclassified Nocardia TaxID=2637762 RepID=UPI003631B050